MADKGKEKGGVADRERASQHSAPAAAKEGAAAPRANFGAVPTPAPEHITVAAHEAASKVKEVHEGKKSAAMSGKRFRLKSTMDVTRGGKAVSILPGVLEAGALTEDEVEVGLRFKVLEELSAGEAKEADAQRKAAEKAKADEQKQRAVFAEEEAERRQQLAKEAAEKLQSDAEAEAARLLSEAGVEK